MELISVQLLRSLPTLLDALNSSVIEARGTFLLKYEYTEFKMNLRT